MSDWPQSGTSFGTPTNPLGAAGAPGVAKTAVRTDDTLPAFNDSVNPADPVLHDPSPGVDAFAARRRHTHREKWSIFLDDFERQWPASPGAAYLAQRHWDGFPWVEVTQSGTTQSIKDADTAADTTYPDTGVLVFNAGTAAGGTVPISGGDISTDSLNYFAGLRDGYSLRFGVAVPAATRLWGFWGIQFANSSPSYYPDYGTGFIFYKSNQSYQVDTGKTITFHAGGAAATNDFVGIYIADGAGNRDVYAIDSATNFIAASSIILDCRLDFARSGSNYNITGTIAGVGSPVTVNAVPKAQMIGWAWVEARITTTGPSTGTKLYLDYVETARPRP